MDDTNKPADTAKATDSVLPQASGTPNDIVKPTYRDNTDTFKDSQRVSQQRILPTALANRLFSQILSFSDTTNATFLAPNAQSTTITATLSNNNNQPIFAIPEISVYIGISTIDEISDLNQWPTAAVGGGNFPIYFNSFDYGQASDNDQVARVTCRNNTGAAQQILIVIQWKVLTFPIQTPNTSTSNS